MTAQVKFVSGKHPVRRNLRAAGFDLPCSESVYLFPLEKKLVGTGIKAAIPQGHAGLICLRSGVALRSSISIANTPGIIDEDYRGEIKLILRNYDDENPFQCQAGEYLAQLVIVPVVGSFAMVEELNATDRGSKGFGSSNTKKPHDLVFAV